MSARHSPLLPEFFRCAPGAMLLPVLPANTPFLSVVCCPKTPAIVGSSTHQLSRPCPSSLISPSSSCHSRLETKTKKRHDRATNTTASSARRPELCETSQRRIVEGILGPCCEGVDSDNPPSPVFASQQNHHYYPEARGAKGLEPLTGCLCSRRYLARYDRRRH
jgi:hypothetical protein